MGSEMCIRDRYLPFAGSPPREGAMERSSLPSIYEVCDDAGVRKKLETRRQRNKGLETSAKEDPWQYIRKHRGREDAVISFGRTSGAGKLWQKGRYYGKLRDGWLKTNGSCSHKLALEACRKEDDWSAEWWPVVVSLERPEDNDNCAWRLQP